MATASILIDAHHAKTLVDDRPKRVVELSGLMDDWAVKMIVHLKTVFAGHSPHHHTIQDEGDVPAGRFKTEDPTLEPIVHVEDPPPPDDLTETGW